MYNGSSVNATAMIDSGAAANFIDSDCAKTHDIPLIPCESVLSVAALDGHALGTGQVHYTTGDISLQIGALHKETIRFFLIKSPQNPVILGLPWLHQHNPQISWADNQIIHWSDHCLQHCLQSPQLQNTQEPQSHLITNLSPEYQDLSEAFSKSKAAQLPPHRSSDCAIELLPGTTPPKGRIFPLSQPESEAMKNYIGEELSKGTIYFSSDHLLPQHQQGSSSLKRKLEAYDP